MKDVVAHLLDTQLRKLVASRRISGPEAPQITSHGELLAIISALNAEGVRQNGRLSPVELISRMEAA